MSALFGASAMLPFQFCTSPKKEEALLETIPEATKALETFGIQLYSVKENMKENPIETIKTIASYGYKQMEGYNGGKGIFWGMDPKEFKTLMDDLGVAFVSSHANTFENLEKQAEEAAIVGMKYLICPWVGPQKSMDDYKRLADEFNKQGEICQKYGLRFAYHNHGYTFEELEGQIPQDYLVQNTAPELVDYEMDTYWVYTAGKDPLEYINKYPGRWRLLHIKDKSGDLPLSEPNGSTLIGSGVLDFQSIISQGIANGAEYFIVEQERFEGTTAMEAAEKNAVYMQTLRY